MIAKIDCITRYEIRQYFEKGDKFLLIRGGFKTSLDALKAVRTMIDNHVYPKDSLSITKSQYANEERVKQDFSICQWFYWSEKMIEYEDKKNEKD